MPSFYFKLKTEEIFKFVYYGYSDFLDALEPEPDSEIEILEDYLRRFRKGESRIFKIL